MGAPTEVSNSADHHSRRPLMTLLIPMIMFGIAAIGLATIVQRRSTPTASPTNVNTIAADTFDRDDADTQDGLAGLPGDREWTEVSGTWAIDLGRAYVADATGAAVALIDDLPRGQTVSIRATIGGTSSCGVVARYVDADNFVSLTHLPDVGLWALTVVEDGVPRQVQRLAAQRLGDVTIQLTVGPRLISATAGQQSASAAESARVGSRVSNVGIFAADTPGSCTWDSIAITSAG